MSKKVCLLIDSLSSGGAEKMVANLSKSLVNKGYDITIVSMRDHIDYSYKGQLYNFGKVKSKSSRFKAFLTLRRYIKQQKFDVILDHRVRVFWLKEFLFSKIVFNKERVVYAVHHYDLSIYFPNVSFPFLVKLTLVKNRKIVAVSQLAKQQIKARLNLESQVIYNYPELMSSACKLEVDGNYIIAVGRLEPIKQFDLLINSYKDSQLPKHDTKLLIFGDGSLRATLNAQIVNYGLESKVVIMGFSKQVDAYIKEAKALVLSSKSEGFPMVLIEAIQQKTPVISFDCKSGPSEIITHNVNGLLVKDQDQKALTEALDKLLDTAFYTNLKEQLSDYQSPFTEAISCAQWVNLIEE